MSTTLTNGLKLPDKGSVDWYADMQNNYSILDGAVGTIAEHTTALSGKAPLVHTHTKSDITDLFNSANTWTGDNTYTATISYQTSYTLGNPPQSDDSQTALKINDSAGANYLAQITTFQNTDATGLRIVIRDKFDSNGFSLSGSNRNKYFTFLQNAANQSYLQWDGYINNSVAPLANNSYDLGSSSYQWNNLYAKNYYYNGTAWGLDKANKWSNYNSYSKGIELAGNRYAYILPEFAANYSGISILTNSFGKSVKFGSYTVDENSVVSLDTTLGFIEISAGIANNVNSARIQPKNAVVAELGTSANKWKSFNGVNPGALSLPSSHYVEIGTDGWDLSGATYNRVYINNANPTFPGILFIRINSTTLPSIIVRLFATSGLEITYSGNKIEAVNNNMIITVPCPPSTNIYVSITTSSSIYTCRYYTLLGDPEFDSRSGS